MSGASPSSRKSSAVQTSVSSPVPSVWRSAYSSSRTDRRAGALSRLQIRARRAVRECAGESISGSDVTHRPSAALRSTIFYRKQDRLRLARLLFRQCPQIQGGVDLLFAVGYAFSSVESSTLFLVSHTNNTSTVPHSLTPKTISDKCRVLNLFQEQCDKLTTAKKLVTIAVGAVDQHDMPRCFCAPGPQCPLDDSKTPSCSTPCLPSTILLYALFRPQEKNTYCTKPTSINTIHPVSVYSQILTE